MDDEYKYLNDELIDIYGDIDFSDIVNIIDMYKIQIDCHIFVDIFTQLCEQINAIEGLLFVLPGNITLSECQSLSIDEKYDMDNTFICYNYLSANEDESPSDFYRRFMRKRSYKIAIPEKHIGSLMNNIAKQRANIHVRTARCNILYEHAEYTVFSKVLIHDSSSDIDFLEVLLKEYFPISGCEFPRGGTVRLRSTRRTSSR